VGTTFQRNQGAVMSISEGALRIIKDYWPTDSRNPLPLFREMQLHLIRYHFPEMSQEDQERAIDTMIRLQENEDKDLV